MKSYKVKISHSASSDIENLSDFLLTVMSVEGARKYLDNMIAEVRSLEILAD